LRTRLNKRYNFRHTPKIDYNYRGKNIFYTNISSQINKKRIKRVRQNNIGHNTINSKITSLHEVNNQYTKSSTCDKKVIESKFTLKEFNKLDRADNNVCESDEIIDKNEWVSATSIKNYLLKDPCIDWLKMYYYKGVKVEDKSSFFKIQKGREKKKLNILYDMGNKFEDEVIKEIKKRFPTKIMTVAKSYADVKSEKMNDTIKYMMMGVPFIDQAVLYNFKNGTFGVADILIRSDYINKLIKNNVLTDAEESTRGKYLCGNYHYIVIDIKWTTIELCADGKHIRNNNRIPAYKGQLLVYNAALGLIQGYTPTKAYILAKAWTYTKRNVKKSGYDCFSTLGVIDYDGIDNNYLQKSKEGIKWIRDVRYNGNKWIIEQPTVSNLYPNMCNRYDTPYHRVKKNIANKIDEITSIWMIGIKNRAIAHSNGIYKWSNPRCNAKNMGINGKKVGPIIDKIIKINRGLKKIDPKIIKNNYLNWQNNTEIEFFIDFESINDCFYNRNINLKNSNGHNGIIFMVGVGYKSKNKWKYRSFCMNDYTIEEEKRVINEFINFINDHTNKQIKRNTILNKQHSMPTMFHWGHAEISMFNIVNKRHSNIWSEWKKKVNWINFCKIFQDEPIVLKGAKKFGLKDIATVMYNYGYISSKWSNDGPCDGLTAMIEAADYYIYISKYMSMTNKQKAEEEKNGILKQYTYNYNLIKKYNEIDCKVVFEIVEYLRKNHCV
jgi:hypothetical protein